MGRGGGGETRRNGTGEGNKRKRKGMPSHRGLSSPTKEDYRICLLVDHHRCRSFHSLLSSSTSLAPSSLLVSSSPSLSPSLVLRSHPSRLFQFLSPERNAMATLRGTKFRRKFLRKSHCHLSRSLIRRTYRSSGEVSPPARRCPFAPLETQRAAAECFYYRGNT